MVALLLLNGPDLALGHNSLEIGRYGPLLSYFSCSFVTVGGYGE